ncbi:alpha/beta fold hydrolase [Kocuria rosea]|uniref:alpha/beta fold hydrolase n=1 Tax=Kocuria rosea TaxID=1275 RepID=UPI00203A4333|nr:alpha/beta hydrolase [Kocuria rosea]MCM3688892.1 alpha/beta hydrolase [Kocuria rosea]
MATTVNPDDGTEISYRTAGPDDGAAAAATVVLLHGTALSKAVWQGYGFVPALRTGHRVLAVDLRGHGRSGKPGRPEDYAMDLVAGDVAAVLAAERTGLVHVVGYSYGARIGLHLAATRPGLLGALTAIAGTWRGTRGRIGELFFPGFLDALRAGIADGRGMEAFVTEWERSLGHRVDPATRAAMLANDARAMLAYMTRTEEQPGLGPHEVAAITVPTLFVVGERDAPQLEDSAAAVRILREHGTRTRLDVVPGRGHGDVLGARERILDSVARFHGGPAGAAGTETVR